MTTTMTTLWFQEGYKNANSAVEHHIAYDNEETIVRSHLIKPGDCYNQQLVQNRLKRATFVIKGCDQRERCKELSFRKKYCLSKLKK